MLTSERANELLHYNPQAGVLRWRVAQGNQPVGGLAGTRSRDSHQYVTISLDGHRYQAHRVIFLMVMGEWPVLDPDHKNRNRQDNRWSNLREATVAQNRANSSHYRNNTTGYRGVVWHKKRQHYVAQIGSGETYKYLGSFKTVEEAALVRNIAAKERFGEFCP